MRKPGSTAGAVFATLLVATIAFFGVSTLFSATAQAQTVQCNHCGGRCKIAPGGLGRCKKWTNVGGRIVRVGTVPAPRPAPRPASRPAPKPAPSQGNDDADDHAAHAPAAEVKPPVIEVWPRIWKAWDDAASARTADPRFQLAKGIPRETLPTNELVPICVRIPRLEKAVQREGDISAEERAELIKLLQETRTVFFPGVQNGAPVVNAKISERLNSTDLAREEVEEFCAQALRAHRLKLHLGRTRNIPDDTRTQLAQEYDKLGAFLHE